MMFDKIFAFFDRSRKDGDGADQHPQCEEEKDAEKWQKRRDMERRETEARRVNDALEGVVQNMQGDRK